ncbi:MAG: DNA mismatch repair endonuclease MutL [Clostridia bacterium]
MRQIRVLPPHIADLIAAGEVVERPMSVIKEILENSIDAQATDITVEIENGGITYMRITDNGIGISKNDAPIIFLRHATSKIYEEDDLLSIKTLGFRGEALAAISAVAKIDLFTKRREDSTATFVNIHAGEVQSIKEVGSNDGTTIIIRDLFFNTPARMKFLKKDYTEASYVLNVVQNLALANPKIAFKFIKDGKKMFQTTGKGDLKSTIYSILGKEITTDLIEVEPLEIEGAKVFGFISKPHTSKKSRAMQHFYVNKRYIKSRLIMSALEESYKNSIMHGKFPYCILNIEIDERKIDVNVHPTKMEIKFEREKDIFNAVYVACKNALENQNIIATPTNIKPVIKPIEPVFIQEEIMYKEPVKEEKTPINYKSTKFDESTLSSSTTGYMTRTNTYLGAKSIDIEFSEDDFLENYEQKEELSQEVVQEITKIAPKIEQEVQVPKVQIAVEKSIAKPIKIIGECFNTYILCEYDGEMVIIDKHAAHERLNFNKLMQNVGKIQSQMLLLPKNVQIAPENYGVFIENLQEINNLGFEIEEFSENSVVVRAIPAILEKDDINDVLEEIASKLRYNKNVKLDKIDDILHTVACKSAIKGNLYTNMKELENLASDVLLNSDANYCPHGRPVKVALSKKEFEKMFKRIV